MKPLPKKFLKIDDVLQGLLFVLLILGIVIFPFNLLALILLGGWQLISAIYLAFKYNNTTRVQYLGAVLLWGLLALLVYSLNIDFLPFMVVFLFLPFCMSIWYYWRTREDLAKAKKEKIELKDVLDYNMD